MQTSVVELAAGFSLRSRVDRMDYLAGRAIAKAGRVTVVTAEPERVELTVADGDVHTVVLRRDGAALAATCTCSTLPVCRHAVAAEHVLWLQAKR